MSLEVAFFDIGDTLATAGFDSDDRLVLTPLPGVLSALQSFQASGLRLGLISHTGNETTETMQRALAGAGLYRFFAAEPGLLIYSSVVHKRKDSPAIFRLACERAGLGESPERCVFVGENDAERDTAAAAGLTVAASTDELLKSPR
jgi:FMN phosphatase YigB (HAD superfamily)